MSPGRVFRAAFARRPRNSLRCPRRGRQQYRSSDDRPKEILTSCERLLLEMPRTTTRSSLRWPARARTPTDRTTTKRRPDPPRSSAAIEDTPSPRPPPPRPNAHEADAPTDRHSDNSAIGCSVTSPQLQRAPSSPLKNCCVGESATGFVRERSSDGALSVDRARRGDAPVAPIFRLAGRSQPA